MPPAVGTKKNDSAGLGRGAPSRTARSAALENNWEKSRESAETGMLGAWGLACRDLEAEETAGFFGCGNVEADGEARGKPANARGALIFEIKDSKVL